MHTEDYDSKPPGFVRVEKIIGSAKSSRRYRFEMFLPERVAEQIDNEERSRQDKVVDTSIEEKIKGAAPQAEAPPSVMQESRAEKAKPDAAAAFRALLPGLDYEPNQEHLIYAPDEPDKVLERAKLTTDELVKARDVAVLAGLKNRGPLRKIINPALSSPSLASFERLAEMHPHFAEVIDFVKSHLALSRASTKPLRIPPILLFGGPGLGKSHFTRDLAAALGSVCHLCSMDGSVSNATLLGLDRKWGNSAPGVLFDLLCLGDCANPVVLLDELDKAGRCAKDDPLAPLHSLLEPSTAKGVCDASMNFEFDASLVTWIATANHVVFLPSSLRSRFREFRIDHPNAEQAITLAFSVANDVVEKAAPPGFSEPKREVVLKLAHLTPREVYQVVEQAIGRAVLNHRTTIELGDLPVDLLQLDAEPDSRYSAGGKYVH